ncbi:MAG: immunoglobulin domain-containing protein [Limisphaerales bacterium]
MKTTYLITSRLFALCFSIGLFVPQLVRAQASPGITTQPSSQTVISPAGAVFSVVASGQATLTYQWLKDGAALSDSSHVAGSATAALTISSTDAGDNGSYSVVVTNKHGSVTSSDATLTVLFSPTITQQPSSLSIGAGTNAVFSAAGTGTEPLTNQWLFNGVPLNDGGRITGSTSTTLTFASVTTADAGSYSLAVSNAAGSATSLTATLFVGSPPVITIQPQSRTLLKVTNVVFAVVTSGTAPRSYQWSKDGGALSDSSHIVGATNSALTIFSAWATDAASYRVVVTNGYGSVTSSNATLTVWVPPTISQQPASLAIGVGTNAVFSAAASGTTPLTNQWWFNGAPLVPNARVSVSEVATSSQTVSTLVITNVQPSDGGSYTLVSRNIAGSATSSVVTLFVGLPPSVTVQPQDQLVPLHGSTSLSVDATGTGPFAYQWYRDGLALLDDAQTSGTQASTLSILNALSSHQGSYSVVLSNAFGMVTSGVAMVTVALPPTVSSPTNVTAVNTSNAVFQVTITGNQPLTNQWLFNGAPLVGNTRASVSEQATSSQIVSTLVITNVQASDTGSYSVLSTNIAGSATSSVATLKVVFPPAVTGQPQSRTVMNGSNAVFTAVAIGQATLAYQWTRDTVNLVGSGHVVGATNSSLTIVGSTVADAGSYQVTVTDLYGSATSAAATLTVVLPPNISAISNQKMFPFGAARTIAFSVNDPQNSATTVTVQSLNTSLLANTNLVLGGSGSNRTLTITPGVTSGTATVRVTAQNSYGAATQMTFTVTFASFSLVPAGLPDLQFGIVKWGDYDNDGRLDLFLSGWDTNFMPHTYLFHNDGNGAFSSVAAAFTDIVYSSAEWVDFDNDGYLDIVLAGYNPVTGLNPVRVFRNLRNGQFALAATVCDAQSGAVACGDYDNDGKPDIAVTGSDPRAFVFRNMGNWSFVQKQQLVGGSSGSVSWVDVNGDGYLDLFVAGPWPPHGPRCS